MEDERRRKIEVGREKLAAYSRRKNEGKRSGSDHSSLSQSDTSLSLSPLPLSDNNKGKPAENANSGSSSISENIELSNSENDRSLHEIFVANIPLDSPEHSSKSIVEQNAQKVVTPHSVSAISDSSVVSLNALEKFENALENFEVDNFIDSAVRNVLDEIIKGEDFDSKTESLKSNPLDDLSSVTLKSERFSKTGCEGKTNQDEFVSSRRKSDAEVMSGVNSSKGSPVLQVSVEIDSLKEVNSSNPSTLSLGTSTTEYNQYYDKINNVGNIEFQDLLSHRDAHIKQLTEALQQVLEDRNNLQEQTGYFAQEIADLKEQLVQTTAFIKRKNGAETSGDFQPSGAQTLIAGITEPQNVAQLGLDPKSRIDEPQNVELRREESESTSLHSLANYLAVRNAQILPEGSTEINFDFEDPEFNETMTQEEKKIVAEMRNKINLYIQQKVNVYKNAFESEIKILKDQLEYEKKLNEGRTKNPGSKITDEKITEEKTMDSKNTEENISSLKSEETQSKTAVEEKNLEINDAMFNETFTAEEMNIIADLKTKIYMFIQHKIQESKIGQELEVKILKDRIESEKTAHAVEIDRFRQLLTSIKSGSIEITELRQELNEQHNKEMEELRTYFEQRCADIEKHYSEEIFSQQSRKMSGSSVCSELESEVYPIQPGPCGDSALAATDPTKTDLTNLRTELQNKYHAELEILREDYENRLDELKINNENLIQDLEQKYRVEINALKADLEEVQKNAVTTQEVASSGDFEIAEVVESYERRLQEQVMLAKIDIISALEQQIQTLVSSTSEDLEWPSELLQLRDRLTEHWHSEIQDIKAQHAQEITLLKEDHEKALSRALERERRNSLKNGDDADIRKERDNLKKVTSNLRHLVAELIKYFTKCEDELNNTLVEELLKYGFDKDFSKAESDFNDSSQSGSDHPDALTISPRVKRVHFTPDVTGIIDLINESTWENLDISKDLSSEFRTELDICLERLKSEANAILSLTSNLKARPMEITSGDEKPVGGKLSSLTRQLITETQMRNELNSQLEETRGYILNLEAEKQSLEVQLEQMVAKQQILVAELDNAKEKIGDLIESGRKEIVSEGYGENEITSSTALGTRMASLAELQERARMFLAEATTNSSHPLLQLIEDLCRESDKILEDAKKDHEDLVQQIEAADKKLRATTQFLEEQAVDREQERDEAQKEIAALKEQLRDGERTRASCERINTEDSKSKDNKLNACCDDCSIMVLDMVERLELQMREMTQLMTDCEAKKTEVENELKEAIDKIWVLRDIIRDLESQIEDKSKVEIELKNIVTQLEDKLKFESKQNEELGLQIDTLKNHSGENRYEEIIRQLEAEIQKLRVSSELVGPDGALKQVKTQLNEIEKTLEKRTKDLESLHAVISNTNCSSPSEDMSIRDQIQIRSPSSNENAADSDLPLEQLARLKDKLIRHARAEDAAMKRIRDLEMQLFTAKQDFDEMQSERDVLQDQLSEQMVLISSLQLRLDEQRLRVEAAQKQSNTSFEHKIYELENEIQELKEAVHIRDRNIKQLTQIGEQTKQRLADQQKQLNSASDLENQLVDQFQSEINKLKSENETLKTKPQPVAENLQENASGESQSKGNLTSEFLDSILADKNADIDRLKQKLAETEQELQFYSLLSFTKEQLAQLSTLDQKKLAGFTSLVESMDLDPQRRQEETLDSLASGEHLPFKRNVNETVFIGSTMRDSKFSERTLSPFVASELSSIEKISPVESGDLLKGQKHVHFGNETEQSVKLVELSMEVQQKDLVIKDLKEKLQKVSSYNLPDFEGSKSLPVFAQTFPGSERKIAELRIELEKKDQMIYYLREKVQVSSLEGSKPVGQISGSPERKLAELQAELGKKDQMLKNLKEELQERSGDLEVLTRKLQETLKNHEDEVQRTENYREEIDALRGAIENYQDEIEGFKSGEKDLRVDLAEAKMSLQERESKLEALEKDVGRKDQMYLNLAKEKRELEQKISELENRIEEFQDYERRIEEKNKEIFGLEQELAQVKETSSESLKEAVLEKEAEIRTLLQEVQDLEVKIAAKSEDLKKLTHKIQSFQQEMTTKDERLVKSVKEQQNILERCSELSRQVSDLQEQLHNKNEAMLKVEEALQSQELKSVRSQLDQEPSDPLMKNCRQELERKEQELVLQKSLLEGLDKEIQQLRIHLDGRTAGDGTDKNLDLSHSEVANYLKELETKEQLLIHQKILIDGLNKEIQRLRGNLELRIGAGSISDSKEIENYKRDLAEKEQQLIRQKSQIDELTKEIQHLQGHLNLQESPDLEVSRLRKELAEKELQLVQSTTLIEELNKEVHHLQEYLNEKDKIINQMTVDSNSLHVALEAIQSKMQESGNVIDLKKRLREEQNLTSALHEELKYLKQSIEQYEYMESSNATEALVLLKESVEREKITNQDLKNTKDALLVEIQQLKNRLKAEEEKVMELLRALEEEKLNSNAVQVQDANIIESMRVRLEALLDHETESEKLLQIEKKTRQDLEKQIASLHQKTGAVSLESNLKVHDANFDLTCLKMDLVKVTTENEILKSDLHGLKNLQSLLKAELKQSKELNEIQKVEVNNLKQLISRLQDSNHNQSHSRKTTEPERALITELQEKNSQMRVQIEELRDHLKKIHDREKELTQLLLMERNKQLESPVPEKFLQKMKELTSLLQSHISDNKQMSNTLAALTEERKTLQNRVKELESRLNIKTPFDDPVARADHLFGRYLKSESYRKALVFQKRYLLTLLASYQRCSAVNLAELNFVLPRLQTSKGLNRFRIAVYAVISIRRMQYIVQRWHTGKRIGASVILKRPVVPPVITSPVPSSSNPAADTRPWVGNSPPCKDRTNKRSERPLGNIIQESITLAPLQTPALLSQYIERFDSIQQRLGLALDRPST